MKLSNQIKLFLTSVMLVFLMAGVSFARQYEEAPLVGYVTNPSDNMFGFSKILYIPATDYFLALRGPDGQPVVIDTRGTGALSAREINIGTDIGLSLKNWKFINGRLYLNAGAIYIYEPLDEEYAQYNLVHTIHPLGPETETYDFVVAGNLLYVTNGNLIAYPLSSDGGYDYENITAYARVDNLLYHKGCIFSGTGSVYDVSNPYADNNDHFRLCTSLPTEITPFFENVLVGDYVYATGVGKMYVIDISSPCNPVIKNTIQLEEEEQYDSPYIAYDNDMLYLLCHNGLHLYSIAADPEKPEYVKSYTMTYNVHGYDEHPYSSEFIVREDKFYSATMGGFFVYDLSGQLPGNNTGNSDNGGTGSNDNNGGDSGSSAGVIPKVTVNGSSKAELSIYDSLTVDLSLSIPGELQNYEHFFWIDIGEDTCICLDQNFDFDLCDCDNPIPAYGGPTKSFNDVTLLYLDSLDGVPIGTYYFNYAVDTNVNNHFDYDGQNKSTAELDMRMILF